MMRTPDTSRRLVAALGKWAGLFARLALIFHLIEHGDANAQRIDASPIMVLPEATAARAAAFLREIALPHLLRADALMFATEQAGHAAWIAGHILAHRLDRITSRDVVRHYRSLRAPENRRELLDVMEALTCFGWIEPEEALPGRPPSSWQVNPAVHGTFGVRAEAERTRRAAARAEIRAYAEVQRLRGAAAPGVTGRPLGVQ